MMNRMTVETHEAYRVCPDTRVGQQSTDRARVQQGKIPLHRLGFRIRGLASENAAKPVGEFRLIRHRVKAKRPNNPAAVSVDQCGINAVDGCATHQTDRKQADPLSQTFKLRCRG